MNDKHIEQEIQDKGLTAPRVTPDDIENNILVEHYTTADKAFEGSPFGILPPLEHLTLCVIVLKNGFIVTGESACASPENFDAEIGRKIARGNAINKVWPLMGYALKESLSAAK
jgi:Phage protein (N4 Gp49/phage Sf6 gene 66) family